MARKFDLWILSDEDSEFPTSKSSQLSETASSASEDSHAEPDGTFASHTIECKIMFTNIQHITTFYTCST
jgi:hypothetical protein